MSETKPKLWTHDFTIITLGTVVSMLGNCISGFAVSLMVLEYTGSTFLYALFIVAYSLPKVIMPLIAGPYLDSFSRKKTIYTLDFVSSALYFGMFLLISNDIFSYIPFLFLCFLIGAIDSTYQVAYESFYPTLVRQGQFTKAYAVSSLIYPFTAMSIPIASYVYRLVGFAPLFAFNSATFFIAAVFETRVRAEEEQMKGSPERADFAYLKSEFRAGLDYLKSEKGLLVITGYFFFTMMAGSCTDTLMLPFFKTTGGNGVQLYAWVMAANVFGRVVGGIFHYGYSYKPESKYKVALAVYITITFMQGALPFTPAACMLLLSFGIGCLAVNSYNIRIAATQSYVPNDYRARFNSIFLVITTIGSITGELGAGAMGEVFSPRFVMLGSQLFNLAAIYFIIWRGRKAVMEVYNRTV